ncbi:MAG TPA: hypothetical protein DCX07_10590 [Phycisphaerales bacterium]|nr:hypothetical protein [Phycisphaerales bacterium]
MSGKTTGARMRQRLAPNCMRARRNARARNRGIALIWAALMATVLIGFVGVAFDGGYTYYTAHQLQNAADAASLAGALALENGVEQTNDASVSVALACKAAGKPVQLVRNDDNVPDGDIVVGIFDRANGTFTPSVTGANAVLVVARRTQGSPAGPVPLSFGSFFGVDTTDVQREAIAMVDSARGGEGLLVLHPTDRASLRANGTVNITIDGGGIVVDSAHGDAAVLNGTCEINATRFNTVGGKRVTGSVTISGTSQTGVSPVPDPLADLPAPSYNPALDLGTVSYRDGTVTISPGYYSGGIQLSGTADVTMQPGIYVLGGDLDVGGSAKLTGDGVMVYLLSGGIKLHQHHQVQLTAPDPDVHSFPGADTYEGIALFQARNNSQSADILGTSDMIINGGIYLPFAEAKLAGNAGVFASTLIAYTVSISGTSSIYIDHTQHTPPTGKTVLLVR